MEDRMKRQEDGTVTEADPRADLHRVLLEATDPLVRAQAHLELGRQAMRDGRLESAVRHLREALVLDRRIVAARSLLRDLGEGSTVEERPAGRKSMVKALLGRLRSRD